MYKILTDISGDIVPNETVQCVFRIKDNAFIPMDELNKDYQEYLEWLSEGNTPEEEE